MLPHKNNSHWHALPYFVGGTSLGSQLQVLCMDMNAVGSYWVVIIQSTLVLNQFN